MDSSKLRPIRFDRRTVLFGAGAAGLGGVIASSLFVQTVQARDLARSVLVGMVGPFRMSPLEFQHFMADFDRGVDPPPPALRAGLLVLSSTQVLHPLAEIMDGRGPAKKFDQYRRRLVTTFLLSTDYLQQPEGPDKTVKFVGSSAACANPFARFNPD